MGGASPCGRPSFGPKCTLTDYYRVYQYLLWYSLLEPRHRLSNAFMVVIDG